MLYADGFMDAAIRPTLVNPVPQGVISIASLAINVLALALIIKRSKEQKKNPYKQEIFTYAKDFQLAMARAEDVWRRKNLKLEVYCIGNKNSNWIAYNKTTLQAGADWSSVPACLHKKGTYLCA